MTFRIVSIGDCIFKLAFHVNHIKIRNVRGYFTNPWGHVWVENRTEFQSFPEDRKHAFCFVVLGGPILLLFLNFDELRAPRRRLKASSKANSVC